MRLALGLVLAVALHAQPSYLHVTILDPSGALIVHGSVKVASDSTQCEAHINTEFKYMCTVPAGTYTLTTDIQGFLPERRTAMTLPPGNSFVKIRPLLNGLGIALTVDEKGLHEVVIPSPEPPPRIEEHRVNGTDVLIRYKEKTTSDGIIVFGGQYERFRGSYLMLTSNLLTVHAETIACEETFQSCSARGNVRVETGTGEELEGTQADIDLLNHKFKLTRAATVEQSF